jgi:hypothetical protein
VIVSRFVVADAFPVKRLGRSFRRGITIEHLGISAFGVRPIFAHERDASETQLQLRPELVGRQITFESKPFLTVGIENEYGWRPQCVEAVEVRRVFLDMDLERDEVFIDE